MQKTTLWFEDAVAAAAFVALLAVAPLPMWLEKPATTDDAGAWHRRHERNSAECRGQQYVAHCCDDARTDLTCIDANLKETK